MKIKTVFYNRKTLSLKIYSFIYKNYQAIIKIRFNINFGESNKKNQKILKKN